MRSRLRFALALCLAAVLGGLLVFSSIGGSLETYSGPGELQAGTTYRLNGHVSRGAPAEAAELAQSPQGLRFQVEDKKDPARRVTVLYRGTVPDQFRVGREVVVTGRLEGDVFVARRNELITLCPSKFTEKERDATLPDST